MLSDDEFPCGQFGDLMADRTGLYASDFYFARGRVRCFFVAGFVRIRCDSVEGIRILTNPATLNTHRSQYNLWLRQCSDQHRQTKPPTWKVLMDCDHCLTSRTFDVTRSPLLVHRHFRTSQGSLPAAEFSGWLEKDLSEVSLFGMAIANSHGKRQNPRKFTAHEVRDGERLFFVYKQYRGFSLPGV